MSRPANPSYSVPVWAPDLNYPAGAQSWSATPTKSPHAGAASVGYTPKTGVPAQCINKNLNDAYTTDQSAKDAQTQWVNYLGQIQALNWPHQSTPGVSAHWGVFYVEATRRWFMTGDVEDVKSSTTGHLGINWDATSLVAAVGANEDCRDGDGDASGNVVVATTTNFIFEMTASTGTWSKVDLGVGLTSHGGVVFDPVRSLWCWAGRNGGGGTHIVKTSPDRTTWTTRTNPSGFVISNISGSIRLAVNKSTGRIIMTE